MAYQQSAPTDISNVLASVKNFAASLGWTVERDTMIGDEQNITLSRVGFDYVHLLGHDSPTPNNFRIYRSIGYDSGLSTQDQVNRSGAAKCQCLNSGPYINLYLFGEDDSETPYIHGVLEISSGVFRHFGFGRMVKKGVYTNGDYCHGTDISQSSSNIGSFPNSRHAVPFSDNGYYQSESSWVRIDECDAPDHDITGVDERYVGNRPLRSKLFGAGVAGTWQDISSGYIDDALHAPHTALSKYNQRLLTYPLSCFCARVEGKRSYIGHPPAMRCTTLEAFAPGDEFTVGSETYKVFPMIRKGPGSNNNDNLLEGSDDFCYAYRKVV